MIGQDLTVTGTKRVGKDAIERMCRLAGLVPARRETLQEHDVFIADGFCAKPHETFRRFGVEPGEFPFGCYATIFWTAKGEDLVDIGIPLFFDAFHDPSYDKATKHRARLNRASEEAKGFLARKAKNAKPH